MQCSFHCSTRTVKLQQNRTSTTSSISSCCHLLLFAFQTRHVSSSSPVDSFQYCRFQQTLLNLAYFLVDSSRADWREFTYTSARTASASCSTLWQGRDEYKWRQHFLHFWIFLKVVFLNALFTCTLLSLPSILSSAGGFLLVSPKFKTDFCMGMMCLAHQCKAVI